MDSCSRVALHRDQRRGAYPAGQSGPRHGAATLREPLDHRAPTRTAHASLQLPAEPRGHQAAGRGCLHVDRRPGRQQIAILDLGDPVTLDDWFSPELQPGVRPERGLLPTRRCMVPDDNRSTSPPPGTSRPSGPGSSTHDPRAELCDAARVPSDLWCHTSDQLHRMRLLLRGRGGRHNVTSVATSVGPTTRSGATTPEPARCRGRGWPAVRRPTAGHSWNPTRSLGHGVNDMVLTSGPLDRQRQLHGRRPEVRRHVQQGRDLLPAVLGRRAGPADRESSVDSVVPRAPRDIQVGQGSMTRRGA